MDYIIAHEKLVMFVEVIKALIKWVLKAFKNDYVLMRANELRDL
jgi:hypothetical protein